MKFNKTQNISIFALVLVLLLSMEIALASGLPVVKTFNPSAVGFNSAILNGSANPMATSTVAWFEWGGTSSLGQIIASQSVGSGTGPISYSFNLTGLNSNTTYYYKAVAQNSVGIVSGNVVQFTTPQPPPPPPLILTANSPIDGNTYDRLPIPVNGSVYVSVCANSSANILVKIYLDGGLIYTKSDFIAEGTGGKNIFFGTNITSLAPGSHTVNIKLYRNSSLYKEINRTFKASRPAIDIKVNNSNGPITVEMPNSYNLSWASKYTGNSVSLTARGAWAGSNMPLKNPLPGSSILPVRGAYTYILEGVNDFGTGSDSVSVKVIQVPRCSFWANPSVINLPESSELNWSCQYADSCLITNNVNSDIINLNITNDKNYRSSGIQEVRPSEDTIFTLTCQGLDGERSFGPAAVDIGFLPWLREILPIW